MTRRYGVAGQATPLVVVAMLLVGVFVAAAIQLGAELVGRGRAQAVADLTALAAAHDRHDASTVAAHNHAQLVDVVLEPDDSVSVTIELAGRRATAAATVWAP